MTKKCLVLFLSLAAALAGQAQQPYAYTPAPVDSSRGAEPGRWFTGGSMGMYFGDLNYLHLSPLLGYRLSDLFSAGMQLNAQYQWNHYRNAANDGVEKESYGVLGGGVFLRGYPLDAFFLQGQPEYNRVFGRRHYADGSPPQRFGRWVPSFLAGAGIAMSAGQGSAVTLMVMYDVLQDEDSPYGPHPVFRGGVNIGF